MELEAAVVLEELEDLVALDMVALAEELVVLEELEEELADQEDLVMEAPEE